jgi:hemerythrin
MAILQWDEWYETGILSIDHQHQTMFDALNRIYDAISSGEVETIVRRALDSLVDITANHFRDEEARMATIGFAGLAEHQEEHIKLLDQVAEFMAAYTADPTADHATKLALFLVEWIVRHINQMDRKYVATMKASGVT